MSWITDMVLVTRFDEIEGIINLNRWCVENDTSRHQKFVKLNTTGYETTGGTKIFTGSVWAMAGNHFPWEKLKEVFSTFNWTYPDDVVLTIIHNETDSDMTVIRGSDKPQVATDG